MQESSRGSPWSPYGGSDVLGTQQEKLTNRPDERAWALAEHQGLALLLGVTRCLALAPQVCITP